MLTLTRKMPTLRRSQSGINMVDLMMWLVIAALLLAAAIQGIGYYQKAAILYSMKNDADGAGTSTMRLVTESGRIDLDTINDAFIDTKWSKENTYTAHAPDTNGKPYIRVTHPHITDKDVIYLFEACGEEYKIGVNVIPKNGTVVLDACGITSGGSGGGGGSAPALPMMTTVWDNTLPGCPSTTRITLPVKGNLTGTVDWGDGTGPQPLTETSTGKTHVYSSPGIRTITISGTFDQWGETSNTVNYLKCLTDVTRWDETGTTSLNHGFYTAVNLKSISNIPKGVTTMYGTFWGATNFNGDISNWDTSKVTDMSYMFLDAQKFNQNISGWDTSNVTSMKQLFTNAYEFNQPIGSWKTGNVTDMSQVFQSAGKFSADIRNWNTSKVTTLAFTFSRASKFNSPLNWDTSNVTTFEKTFADAISFDQPLNWNTLKATDMRYMFDNARIFNSDISSFRTDNVTVMQGMFTRASSFNQPLAHFNTSNVSYMGGMFSQAYAFNRDISGWDTSKVTSMSTMFNGASAFNQDLSQWKVDAVKDQYMYFIRASYPTAYLPKWVMPAATA